MECGHLGHLLFVVSRSSHPVEFPDSRTRRVRLLPAAIQAGIFNVLRVCQSALIPESKASSDQSDDQVRHKWC